MSSLSCGVAREDNTYFELEIRGALVIFSCFGVVVTLPVVVMVFERKQTFAYDCSLHLLLSPTIDSLR